MIIKTKNQIQIEQQFLYSLAKIVEMCPQYTIAQHLVHFMRRKGESKETYYWKDDLLLNKIENYYDELKIDLVNNIQNQED